MHVIESYHVQCPYCGEAIDLMVESVGIDQEYIEDCQVCCKPIFIKLVLKDNMSLELMLKQENDV